MKYGEYYPKAESWHPNYRWAACTVCGEVLGIYCPYLHCGVIMLVLDQDVANAAIKLGGYPALEALGAGYKL